MILPTKRVLALVAAASITAVQIAQADPPAPPARHATPPDRSERRTPVVQPPGDVDPRMPVLKPDVPTRSRVIRPDTRQGSSGTVVIPK